MNEDFRVVISVEPLDHKSELKRMRSVVVLEGELAVKAELRPLIVNEACQRTAAAIRSYMEQNNYGTYI